MDDATPAPALHPSVASPAEQKADERAILALVFGALGVSVFPLLGIPGIVLGHRARRELPIAHPRRSMALVGIVLGWVSLALLIVVLIPVLLILFVL